jgi:hypothetical protein
LVVIGFAASGPVEEAREPIGITLDEGEARMVTIPYKAGTEPSFEIRGGDAAVVDTAIYLAQKEKGLLHVLVTAVAPGETTWAIGPRAYRVQVRASAPRTGGSDADRAAAIKKMEEGELLERESQRDLSNTFHAMTCFRQAAALLRSIEFGTHDDTYRMAGARHEQLARAWAELYARAEGELAIARMNGDAKAIRRALNALIAIAPDPKSPEYQKNTTIANYVYAEKKKEEQP